MKRIASIILSVVLFVSIIVIPVSADAAGYNKTNTYTLTATQTGKLNIIMKHDWNEEGSWSAAVYKKNSDGSRTKCFRGRIVYANGGTDYFPAIGCKKGETYILEITGSSRSESLNYSIKYSCTSARYETELNNSISTANTLTMGATTTANCWDYDIKEEVDWFKVTAVITGDLILNFKHAYKGKGQGWYVTVLRQTSDGSMDTVMNKRTMALNKTSENLTIKNAKKGAVYYIKVEWPYLGNWSAHENLGMEYSIKPTMKCSTPGKPKAKVKKGKVSFAWKKSSSVSGYEIQISKRSDFKKTVVKTKKTKTTYIKTLSRKTKYYIRVRSYKKVSSKTYYYSSWSTKCVFKTK